MRLFFAVDIPKDIKKKLVCDIHELEKIKVPCKFVTKENLHITLLFLGEVSEEKVSSIIESAENCKCYKADVVIKKFGFFDDNRGNIKIVWRELSKGERELAAITKFLTKANSVILEKNELTQMPFKGHLTMGRIKRSNKTISEKVIAEINRMNSMVVEESFEINEFHLYKSILTPVGPKYELIRSFKLKDRI